MIRSRLPLLSGLVVLTAGGVFLLLIGSGCTTKQEGNADTDPKYLPAYSEDYVLNNLQVAWRLRDIDGYAAILSQDFHYFPYAGGVPGGSNEPWDRATELERVGRLFDCSAISKIQINLSWPPRSAKPANFLSPRDSWTTLTLSDVFLDVDIPEPGEPVTTYRIEDGAERFYFRRGSTAPPASAADTLWYVVEWHERGPNSGPEDRVTASSPSPTPVRPSSWTELRFLCDLVMNHSGQ